MTSGHLAMAPQDAAERGRFENELQRIIAAGQEAHVVMRVLGSLAFQLHCPKYGYLQQKLGRAYTDIDFAAYGREAGGVRALMAGLGYSDNREVFVVSEGARAIFDNPKLGLHVDVFYDRLDFSHIISWAGRLEVDTPSIPLAEMFLEKMQIFRINEKDIIDTIMLILEHPFGIGDEETINMAHVSRLCASDWGLWRTVTMNLQKVAQLAPGYAQLEQDQKSRVSAQVQTALTAIEAEPKTMAWRLRSRVGDRVKWYKDVDEVE
ncbi:MAG: hypothetical protein ABSF61_13890 [Anaerolineales bacterium]|jgi:hypothetical protein